MALIFSKPSLSYAQQISHLRANGMQIADEARAEYWLRHVSYYRLSAYWLYFEKPKGANGPRFQTGTTFDDVTALYDFDRNLRRLVMRGTEHVEVALRGSWAYWLAHSGGPHAYLRSSLYRDRKEFRSSRRKLQLAVDRSSETYITHYRQKYTQPKLPPVWMVAEMMSFGQLSRWYTNLADRALRNRIGQPLGLPETVLVPLVRHVTDMRNICAHHGRLWNRGFLHPPKLAQKPTDLNDSLDLNSNQAPAHLYNGLTLIAHVVRTVAPNSTWAKDVGALAKTHPNGDLASMGFPRDWESKPLWRQLASGIALLPIEPWHDLFDSKGDVMLSWTEAVTDAVHRVGANTPDGVFTRSDLIAQEGARMCADTGTTGETPMQTVSRELQQLRDQGILEFTDDRGTYRLMV